MKVWEDKSEGISFHIPPLYGWFGVIVAASDMICRGCDQKVEQLSVMYGNAIGEKTVTLRCVECLEMMYITQVHPKLFLNNSLEDHT